jgi:hypothetical protein
MFVFFDLECLSTHHHKPIGFIFRYSGYPDRGRTETTKHTKYAKIITTDTDIPPEWRQHRRRTKTILFATPPASPISRERKNGGG